MISFDSVIGSSDIICKKRKKLSGEKAIHQSVIVLLTVNFPHFQSTGIDHSHLVAGAPFLAISKRHLGDLSLSHCS